MSKLPCFDDSAANLDKLLVVLLTWDGALDKKSVPPGAKYEHTLDSWRNMRFTSSLYWSPKKAKAGFGHIGNICTFSSFDVNATTSTVFATLCWWNWVPVFVTQVEAWMNFCNSIVPPNPNTNRKITKKAPNFSILLFPKWAHLHWAQDQGGL